MTYLRMWNFILVSWILVLQRSASWSIKHTMAHHLHSGSRLPSVPSVAGLSNDRLDKVDVDNCDCCFVEDVLKAGIRPLLIHVEVHPLVPPPFVYRPVAA